MKQNRLMPVVVMAVALSACGLSDKDDDALGFEALTKKAIVCMNVHSASVQAGLGPLNVSQGGSDADEIIKDMKGQVKLFPDDAAQLPKTYIEIIDMLRGISGKGIEPAAALAKSPSYTDKVAKLSAWYSANCQAVGKT